MDDSPRDDAWYEETRELLERPYLEAEDPRGQSGFRGDEARWERARKPIVRAINRDGTFLDVGCANGLLMESVATWAAEDGRRIEPHGLDLIESLAALARRRIPQWSGRIFAGSMMDWRPPFRFDFVRTELEYVPPRRRQEMVERMLNEYLVPGGRLIVCSYGSASRPAPRAEPVAELLSSWGHQVKGAAEGSDANGAVITRAAWVDAT